VTVTTQALAGQVRSGDQVSEAALIRAAKNGDQEAFAQLVRLYDQGVLRLALNLLKNPEDARDVYQETFLRVYRNLDSFRLDSSFQTWLYRIATNLCLDVLRRRRVRRQEAAPAAAPAERSDPVENLVDAGVDGNPERRLLSQELDSRIREALDELTPRERMVFELRHYQGMRLKQIGQVLGTTEEAAKNCLFRVTQKLRARLEDFL